MAGPEVGAKNMNENIPNDLYQVMRSTYDELIEFVVNEPFFGLVTELYTLPNEQRPSYVKNILLNPDELKSRSVIVPEGILIQRSAFGDRRPTLFVVKKYLPDGYRVAWENVNLTFDQDYDSSIIKRDESAWVKPLPFALQSALQALGISTEEAERLSESVE